MALPSVFLGGIAAAGMVGMAVRALTPCGRRHGVVETYDQFIARARVGDVVLAASSRRMLLAGMCAATGTPWTHAGVVARLDGGDTLELSSFARRGVDTGRLSDIVVHTGTFWCRHFDGAAAAGLTRSVCTVMHGMRGVVGFNRDPISLFNCVAATRGATLGDVAHGQIGLTCAQATAVILSDAGVLRIDRDISRFLPCVFSNDGDAEWIVRPSPLVLVVGWHGLPVDLSKIK
jgi:hypothetical protein